MAKFFNNNTAFQFLIGKVQHNTTSESESSKKVVRFNSSWVRYNSMIGIMYMTCLPTGFQFLIGKVQQI